MCKNRLLINLGLALLSLAAAPLSAETTAKTAILGLENLGGDPVQAYLGPVIEGLLLYDLTAKGGVDVVDRKNLQKVLAEQEFQQSALTDSASAVKLGQLANARYLIYGGYSLINGEIVLNLQLTDVQTGDTTAFRERSGTEHVVHWAAEKIIRRLTGRVLALAEAANNRSLVSLKDETPGSLALHSKLIGAKIFIDDEFAGFTKGDERTPILFDNLPPGRHTIRTFLANSFGTFHLPELTFQDWQVSVDIRPGRQTALIDDSLAFYDAVAKITRVGSDRRTAPVARKELLTFDKTLTYTTKAGQDRQIRLNFSADPKTGPLTATLTLSQAGQPDLVVKPTFAWPVAGTGETKKTVAIGDLNLETSFYVAADTYKFSWELNRTDIDADALAR